MDPLGAYLKIKDRSLFSLFTETEAKFIVDRSQLSTFEAGQTISRPKVPSELSIVVDGEIGLYEFGNRNNQYGKVISGRAIELKALLHKDRNWNFEWLAETTTYIMKVEWPIVDAILKNNEKLKKYLDLATFYPELQKIKNDLRLFGFAPNELKDTINSFTLLKYENLKDWTYPGRQLAIVHVGEITFKANIDDQMKSVGQFFSGDYFILDPERKELEKTYSEDSEVWCLSEEDWCEKVDSNRAQSFLNLIDPIASRLDETRVSPAVEGEQLAPEPEEDDGLNVSDFAVDDKTLAKIYKNKLVHIKQNDQMDCGAACLATIAQYYGRRISLPVFRSLVHVTRDGASMLSLKKAAEKTGFKSIGIMSGYKGLSKLRVPMIALLQYHFVVIYRVTDTHVIASDPAAGIVTIPVEKFKLDWSKNCLLLKPTKAFFKYPESPSSYGKYFLIFNDSKWMLLETLVASILIFLFNLSTPVFLQYVFDNVLQNKEKGILTALALAVIGIECLSAVTDYVRNYLLTHITSRIDAKFSSLFLRHTLKLPLNFFAVRRVGDITTRFGEIEKVRDFFTGQTLEMVINFLSVFIYCSVIALYSWKLLFVIAVLLPLMVGFIIVMIPRLTQNLQATYKAMAKNQSVTFEQFNSLETLKALNGMVAARWRWEESLLQTLNLKRALERLNAVILGVAQFFDGTIKMVVLLVAVYFYMHRELTLGQVVAVTTIVGNIIRPTIALVSKWNTFNQVGVSLARIDDIITSAPEADIKVTPQIPEKFKGGVEFKNVYFQYGSEMSPIVLENVSFEIKSGEMVALVGGSGSGKTTLAYMVNLLYAPTKGKILIDGIDATQIPLKILRSQVAMIMQDNSLFSGTILENISVGDNHPSFARTIEAARWADAHEFIAKTSNGYSTPLGEGGTGLSGGQKQRINIARALYRTPTILIMDEATSALDALSEQTIVNNIKALSGHCTTILIAHRLNTVMHADRIIVMNKGKLIETGTHQALIQKQGYYYDLFRKQLNV